MDRKLFSAITDQLMELVPRSKQYRKRLEREKRKGHVLPETYEECLIYSVKPQARACEDCEIITACTEKTIYLQRSIEGKLEWWKKCEECGKKSLFVGKK